MLEFSNLRWRLMFCTLLARLLPEGRANGLRTSLIRAIGLDIGRGTRFLGLPKIQCQVSGPLRSRLRIGAHCAIGARVILGVRRGADDRGIACRSPLAQSS